MDRKGKGTGDVSNPGAGSGKVSNGGNNRSLRSMLLGNGYILAATILFALNIPVVKVLVPDWMGAGDVTIFRLAGGCACFWLVSMFVRTQKIARQDFWRIFAGGGLSLFAFIYILNVSLKYGNPIDVSIILTLPPVYIIIYQMIFKHERPTWYEVVGILVSFGGAVIVISNGHAGKHASDPLLGDILAIIASLAYTAYLVILEKPTHVYKPLSMLRWVFLGATVPCLAICWKMGDMSLLHDHPGFMPLFWTFFIVLGPSFLAYLMVNPAIKLIGSELVSIYQYFMPVITTIAAVVMHQARFEWPEGIAIAMILAGMVFTDIGNRKKMRKLSQAKK